MWLWLCMALAITPDELDLAADEAAEQLATCASEGCSADEGAEAAFVAAIHRYQEEGVADGALAATVRFLDVELFGDLPDVLQEAASEPLRWAAPPPVPDADRGRLEVPDELLTADGIDCGTPYTSDRKARVVALQWKGTDTRFDTPRLERRVRDALDHPEVTLVPDVDLYQAGRAEGKRDFSPRGRVPDATVAMALQAVEDNAAIPDEALSKAAWASRAIDLAQLSQAIFFIDRPELRAPQFQLYAELGRAVELGGLSVRPWRLRSGNRDVNAFWYYAAALAQAEPGLLDGLDGELRASVAELHEHIATLEPVMLSFALEDRVFDPVAFAQQYTLSIDGLEVLVTNRDGIVEVPPGRVDVALKAVDGPGMSERVEVADLRQKIYFVRNHAHSHFAFERIQQLMENPNECSPPIDDQMRTHLAVYQQLYPDTDLYVTLPERGSTTRSRLRLWRWDAQRRRLVLVVR